MRYPSTQARSSGVWTMNSSKRRGVDGIGKTLAEATMENTRETGET